jgi:hypothetical protein
MDDKQKQNNSGKPVTTERKPDKKDVIIRKYVAEGKILKLIDRMCNGELLGTDQFDTIFDYVKRKGHDSTIQEEWYIPVWQNGNLVRHDRQIREAHGYRYLGIFAKAENTENVLVFGDTRKRKISSIRRYTSGQLIYH